MQIGNNSLTVMGSCNTIELMLDGTLKMSVVDLIRIKEERNTFSNIISVTAFEETEKQGLRGRNSRNISVFPSKAVSNGG